MAKIAYETRKFAPDSVALIEKVNAVLDEYERQGFVMTLRQVYYQLVKANVIVNSERSYKNLGTLITNARRAGLVDWSRMEDRTRNLRKKNAWETTKELIYNADFWYSYPMWANQDVQPEGWIEKDALLGVLERPCEKWDIPFFACRGYMSDIEQHSAAQRIRQRHRLKKQKTVILHFGDHDPSGIDMTRDIKDRFDMFGIGHIVEVRRMALTMAQIDERDLPPNPAKITDSRSTGYIDRYGESSYELDALNPTEIASLVEEAVADYRDVAKWKEAKKIERAGKRQLSELYQRWGDVEGTIGGQGDFMPHGEGFIRSRWRKVFGTPEKAPLSDDAINQVYQLWQGDTSLNEAVRSIGEDEGNYHDSSFSDDEDEKMANGEEEESEEEDE